MTAWVTTDRKVMMGVNEELEAMGKAYAAIEALPPEQQKRVAAWLATTVGASPESQARQDERKPITQQGRPGVGDAQPGSTDHLKAFLAEKAPKNASERVAALAFYATHYRSMASFKPSDLKDLNGEAGWPDLANWPRDVSNAATSGYVVGAAGGGRKIGARGEALVKAMPDTEAMKQALASGPPGRRRVSKATKGVEKSARRSTKRVQ